jgi:hypothetical protein
MPVLLPTYIGTWYHLQENGTNATRIVESFTKTANQEVNAKPFLQGDIGTHVMEVGGISYDYDFQSEAIILENGNVTSIIDIISNGFAYIRNGGYSARFGGTPASFLMENASIRISQQGVNCSAKFVSSEPNSWIPVYSTTGMSNPDPDFIARTAQWYDCILQYTFHNGRTDVFQIVDANLNIQSTVGKRFFIGQPQLVQDQTPYFSVNSYTVSGSITFMATPTELYNDSLNNTDSSLFGIRPQKDSSNNSRFYANGPRRLAIKIGNVTNPQFDLGTVSMIKSIKTNLKANDISTVTIDFVTYARFT